MGEASVRRECTSPGEPSRVSEWASRCCVCILRKDGTATNGV